MLKDKKKKQTEIGDCALCTGFTRDISIPDFQVPKTPTKPSVVIHDVKARQCEECEEIYYDHLQTMELNQKIIEAQRTALGLLSANDIRTIRSSLKIAKERLEKILGFNPKSFHRWETGISIQSHAADTILRILRKAPEIIEALAEERHIETVVAKGRPRKAS